MVRQDPFGVPPRFPPTPEPPQEEGPLPQPHPELLIDFEGYEADISDIWARDDGYDIWEKGNDDNSSNSNSVVSVINIPESPEVVKISSEEMDEDSWSSGTDTSNISGPDFKPR